MGGSSNFVQVLATLLTEVFLWTRSFIHDPNAAPMLPDLAYVTLYKPAGSIFSERRRI